MKRSLAALLLCVCCLCAVPARAVDTEGARVGAMTGSTAETYCAQNYPDAAYFSFSETADLMAALKSGRLDYAVAGKLDALNYMRADPGFRIVADELSPSDCAIAVAKGNATLLQRIDGRIARYRANGTLSRMKESWIRPDGSDYVIETIPTRTDGPTLRVAICSTLEPLCFVRSGEPVGYDVELIRRIAYDLGYQVVFQDMQFSALLAALESGRADVALSGTYATQERAQTVDFSRAYLVDTLVLMRYGETATNSGLSASLLGSFRKNFLVEDRWKLIVSGVGVTLLLSVCAGALGLLLGFGVCLLRLNGARFPARCLSALTQLTQDTPVVVLLMILYYVVFGRSGLSGVAVSILAFGLNFGASVSDVLLNGIHAVDKGQSEAAASMGFSPAQTFTKIVFPQAACHFLPVLKNEYVSLVKMTSVVGYVAVQDLTKVSDIIRSRTYEAFFPLIVTAILYFLLSFGLSSLLRLAELRIDPKRRPRTVKGVKPQ